MRFRIEADVARPGGFRLRAAIDCEARALGLVGPSGSGKTTLLDAIAGIEPGARVVLDGADCSGLPLHRRSFGYVAQDPLLFPHLSVRANLAYGARGAPVEDAARALGIAHLLDRMPRNLSGGERRRAALARAVVGRPRLLLLDEPFAGLDEPRRRSALSLLDDVRRRYDLPMILVSHLADEVIGLTDQAVRLEDGRVAARGPSASVLRGSDTRIDNYFTGTVVAPGRVRVGGIELAAMLPPAASGEVRLACYAHDVVLARARPEGISARNVVAARVAAVEAAGAMRLVALDGLPLRALVTQEACDALGLRPGAQTHAVIKAASIVCLGTEE
jgi:molybdate transport system ATP-binding protein